MSRDMSYAHMMPRDGGASGVTLYSSAGAGAPLCPRLFFCIPLIEAMAVKCCGVVNVAHACTDDGGGADSKDRRGHRCLGGWMIEGCVAIRAGLVSRCDERYGLR